MSDLKEKIKLKLMCPYCKASFKKEVEYNKKAGLSTVLIKEHPNSQECPPFVAFIDNNGKHRGSQKIDSIEQDIANDNALLENARNRINELKETLRFYHLKMPRKGGRGFEYTVANVTDRAFMSTPTYTALVDFLSLNEENNSFGIITLEKNHDFEGGLLTYGKYLGMIYTIFWEDQNSLQDKTFDDLKGYANLTVEKLLDIYELTDFFF
ncbi:MAG: hypothetical protein EU539_05930 [Promethearchaeota archaeon]|nr:MAG: hypothetical protein EU539_05930 [Candidatus Lokiarchaeota archaeon]